MKFSLNPVLPILVLILGLLASCSPKTSLTTAKTRNINGLWKDVNSNDFANCYVIFAQHETKVAMNHYLEFKGQSMVEYGIGTIQGNKVQYQVLVTKPIPGWATTGEHILYLNKEENTLEGIYKDGKGNTGTLIFKKIK